MLAVQADVRVEYANCVGETFNGTASSSDDTAVATARPTPAITCILASADFDMNPSDWGDADSLGVAGGVGPAEAVGVAAAEVTLTYLPRKRRRCGTGGNITNADVSKAT